MTGHLRSRWLPWLTLAAALVVVGRARAADEIGWVADLEGTLEVRHAGTDAWTPLAAGAALQGGDRLRTGAGSRAKLLLRDDSVLNLAPASEISLDQQVAAPAPVAKISMLAGKLRAVVTERYGAPGATYEVETPTAVAGVRGTSFVASYDAAQDETLVVGLVDVTTVRALADASGARRVRLGPGQETRVRRGAYPTRPSRIPDAALRNLMSSTTVKRGGGGGGGAAAGGGRNSVAEPRLPTETGERAGSPENRTIDQPVDLLKQRGGVPPPPPPVPR